MFLTELLLSPFIQFDISEIPTTDPNGLENPEAWMEVSTLLTLQTVPESGRYKNDRIQNGLDYNSFLIDKLANDQIDPEDRDAVIGNHFKLFLDMLKENLFKM